MKLIQQALVVLSKIKSLLVIQDIKQQFVDKEVGAIMDHVRASYPDFMVHDESPKIIHTMGSVELDYVHMAQYKKAFKGLGIALLNATPGMQEQGFNMFLRFGNNMLPVKVYKQVHIGRGQRCRMMKPAI
jgi:hypothetical protein